MKNINEILPTYEIREVNNLTPLRFDSDEHVYYVESGKVYLFLVPQLEPGEYGARYHVATFSQGEIFFTLDNTAAEQFIVFGAQNTAVALKSRQDFTACYTEENESVLDAGLANWFNRITQNLRRNVSQVKTTSPLFDEPGRKYAAESLLYSDSVRWVAERDSLICFDGISTTAWGDSGGWFPITSRQNVYLAETGELSPVRTRVLTEQGDFDSQLSRYIRGLSVELIREKQETRRQESSTISEKSRRADRFFSAALSKIRDVVEGGKALFTNEAGEELGSLFIAAELVAKDLNISLQPVPGKEYELGRSGTEEIAKDNNIRVRQLVLRGDWWRKDNGPLLGRYFTGSEEDDQDDETLYEPVALLPRGTNRYVLVNPAADESLDIDTEVAERISARAHMFYRPLPDRKLTPRDIVEFTSQGLHRDVLRYALLGVFGSIIGLLVPEMTRIFFDTIIPEAAKSRMLQISLILFVSAVTVGIFELVKGFAMTRLETKSDASLQAAVMDRVMKLPVPFFRNYTTGDLSDRTMAISQIRRILSGTVLSSIMSFLFSLVYLIQIFRYSAHMAKWGLLIAGVPIIVTVIVSLLQYRYEKQVADLQGSISGTLLQFIMGAAKLNISSSEKRAFGVWAEKFTQKKRMAFKSGFVNNIHATFISFFPVVVSMIFYMLFMKLTADGKESLSTGTFLAFIASYTAFETSLISMTRGLTQSMQVIPLYNRAKPILHALPEVNSVKPAVTGLQGDIEVSRVSFRYDKDGPLILKDVSMTIESGEFVALVGESGSGKSTLLRLLLGFEKAESGSIYYDNQDISSLDITSLRRQFGVVLQNGSVMKGSIFSNIVGSSALTIDNAWEAAEMVGFDKDIREMPMGMHTELPAGGWTLSGGQRQRLIIARAIIRRPNILFFDEATSALDNRSQLVVSRSLETLNVTRIVVAHRLSTIMNADKIYVLQNGVVTERGSYRELMEQKGFFAEIAARQQV